MKINQLLYSITVFFLILVFRSVTLGQSVSVNGTGNPADAQSILDISATDKGVLLPRMTTAQRTSFSPTNGSDNGMLVYDTNTESFWYWDGTVNTWREVPNTSNTGDITSVTAGDGLTGGGTTGAVTLTAAANNGLNVDATADKIQLGGTLTETTIITLGGFDMTYNLSSTGNFVIQDGGVPHFQIDNNDGNAFLGADLTIRDGSTIGTTLIDFTDAGVGGNDGRIQVYTDGLVNHIIDGDGDVVFNDQGIDRDFRIESDNQTNIFRVDAGTDRIGIGIGTPTAQLHTTGTLRFANYTNGFLQVDGSGNVSAVSGASLFTAGTGLSWSGTTLNSVWTQSGNEIHNNNSANVGVGTTSPAEKLHVQVSEGTGNSFPLLVRNFGASNNNGSGAGIGFNVHNGLALAKTAIYNERLGDFGAPSKLHFLMNATADEATEVSLSDARMTILSTGNIGIGSTSPAKKLHVVGDARITGLSAGGNVQANASGDLIISNNLPSGDADYIQNQFSAQQSASEYWISGRGRMDGGLTVGAGATIDNNSINTGSIANGSLAFGNASGEGIGSKRNAGGNQYGLDFYTQSTNRMAITNGGNIGIGTTTPAARLTIADVSTPGYKNLMVGDDSYFTDVDVVDFVGLYGNSNPDQGGLRLGSDGSFIYGDGGNIGVGTAAPTAKLHVNGNTLIQTSLTVDNANGNAGTVASALTFGNLSGEGIGSRRSAGANLYGLDFYTQSINRMVITNQGNVGVGTTAPNATLNVIHPTTNTSPTAPGGFWAALIENRYDANDGRHGLSVATRWGSATSKVFEAASYWTGGAQAYTPILTVFGNRTVGIGNSNPQAVLHVSGSGTNATVAYGYLNPSGTTGTCGSCNVAYTIQADGRIRSTEFNAISDNRIKNVVDRTSTNELLNTVNRLEVTKYEYIDKVANGPNSKEGFIAQQVEEVVPSAIKISSDFIPNIYTIATEITTDEGSDFLEIKIEKPHNLAVGDEVKFITESGEKTSFVSSILDEKSFIVNEWTYEVDQMFVYGKKVDDFRAVDYDQIFSIGIGAIQELSKENGLLKAEVESLKSQVNELNGLKAEIERVKGFLQLDAVGDSKK